MSKTLRLEIGGLSLVLGVAGATPFTQANYPRERIEAPSLRFSARGAAIGEGTYYEPKFLWSIATSLVDADYDTLRLMHNYWVLTQTELYIHDLINPIEEASPRTRTLATGAPGALTLTNPSGWIRYYARFKGWFVEDLKAARNGKRVEVQFQIQETTK